MNAKNVMRRSFPATPPGAWERDRIRRKSARPRPVVTIPGKKLNVVPADQLATGPSLVVGPAGPARALDVVPMKVRQGHLAATRERGNEALGKALGVLAWTCVAAWWLTCLCATVSRLVFQQPESFWSRVAETMFFVGLIGSLFPAVIAGTFLQSGDRLGARAVAAFWGSLLILMPLGWMFSSLMRILAP